MNSLLDTCMESTETAALYAEPELITGIKAGDADAFEELMERHGGRMLAVARRMLGCEQDAQDAFQDAMICVFKNAGSFENSSKLSTWLHRVVVNACLMKLRSERRRHEVEIDELLPTFDETGHHTRNVAAWTDGPVANAEASEMREHVRACIDQLPEAYRTVLLLRDIEQLDTEEAARLMNCTPNCIKTRLHRARQALRTLLEPIFTIAV